MPTSFINLKDKEPWFLKLWPRGNVPIIVFADERGEQVILNESQVLLDFVEEISHDQGPSFLPAGENSLEIATKRAHVRITAARYNESVPFWYKILMSKDKEEAIKVAADYERELLWLQSRMGTAGSPWFSGEQFGYLDATILPWLLRLFVLKHYRGFAPKGVDRLIAYVERARASEVIKKTLLLTDPSQTWEDEAIQSYSSYAGGAIVNYFD